MDGEMPNEVPIYVSACFLYRCGATRVLVTCYLFGCSLDSVFFLFEYTRADSGQLTLVAGLVHVKIYIYILEM